MSIIRPSFVENLFNSFFSLEADRPMYYRLVFRLGKSIFQSMGKSELINELDNRINIVIEKPLHTDLPSVLNAYYNPRFMFSRSAYAKIGDSINYKEVTRYEIEQRLEYIKDWVYDEVTELSQHVRFTNQQPIVH